MVLLVETSGVFIRLEEHPGHPSQKVHNPHGGGAGDGDSGIAPRLRGDDPHTPRSSVTTGQLVMWPDGRVSTNDPPVGVVRALGKFARPEREIIYDEVEKARVPKSLDEVRLEHTEHWRLSPEQVAEELDGMAAYVGTWKRTNPAELKAMLNDAGELIAMNLPKQMIARIRELDRELFYEAAIEEHGSHNQKSHGRSFSRIASATDRYGGASVNYVGRVPKSGYMVGGVVPSKVVKPGASVKQVASEVKSFYSEHRAVLKKQGMYLGTWKDTDGTIYIDISQRASLRSTAMKLGAQRKELAIYDIRRGDSVDVPKE